MKSFFSIFALSLLFGCGDAPAENPEPSQCEDIDCSGHGECNVVEGAALCVCDEGYLDRGLTCIPDGSSRCSTAQCEANATCSVEAGTAVCNCNPGYYSTNNECAPELDSSCETTSCAANSTCQIINDEAACVCDEGFTFEEGNCAAIPPCTGQCANGTCTVVEGAPSCTCGPTYENVDNQCVLRAFVTPQMFGAIPGEEESGDALNDTFAAGLPVVINDTFHTKEILTIPGGSRIRGTGTLVGEYYDRSDRNAFRFVLAGDDIEIRGITFDFSGGGTLYANGRKNLRFHEVAFNNSLNHSGCIIEESEDIEFEKCSATGNSRSGIQISNSSNIRINEGTFHDNEYFGTRMIHSGDITFTDNVAHNNGSLPEVDGGIGKYSGFRFVRSDGFLADGNESYSNQEHGMSLQGSRNFTITNFVSYRNGFAGLNFQSDEEDEDRFPTGNGVISDGQCYENGTRDKRGQGLSFKEMNENIVVKDLIIRGNHGRAIRLSDLGGSGEKSTNIEFTRILLDANKQNAIYNWNDSIITQTDVMITGQYQ